MTTDISSLSGGLLVARVAIGLLMAAHGTQKLFGWFGGYGLTKTAPFFEQLGFHPGRAFAAIASATEVASGLFIAFGFLGPVGPALLISVMIVAAVTVHLGHGLLGTKGIEVPVLYIAAALTFAMTGYGRYSFDTLLGWGSVGSWPAAATWIILAIGVIGGFANLALRRPVNSAAPNGAAEASSANRN
jgi:putative oxidoreductase